ncbi:GTP binding protein, partial [Trifolium pratense]
AGQAIHVGGLARLDLIESSVETIYVTVWASANVSLHMGKIENANEIWNNHVGVRLQGRVSRQCGHGICWKDLCFAIQTSQIRFGTS